MIVYKDYSNLTQCSVYILRFIHLLKDRDKSAPIYQLLTLEVLQQPVSLLYLHEIFYKSNTTNTWLYQDYIPTVKGNQQKQDQHLSQHLNDQHKQQHPKQ